MNNVIRIRLVIVILGLLSTPAALAQVQASGSFRAQNNCEATQSPGAANNPGGIRLTQGRLYEVMGFNSSQREFIQIMIPEANPNIRWARLSCGSYAPPRDRNRNSDSQNG